jgi:hypothetical protein
MATQSKTTVKQTRTKKGSEDRAKISKVVLSGMSSGLSCFKACKAAGVPHSTFLSWVDQDSALADRYARAREDLIEHIATETIDIADAPVGSTDNGSTDSGAVQKQRLQVDTRKWLLARLAPKKYGDKLELAGDPQRPLSIERIERVVINAKNAKD